MKYKLRYSDSTTDLIETNAPLTLEQICDAFNEKSISYIELISLK